MSNSTSVPTLDSTSTPLHLSDIYEIPSQWIANFIIGHPILWFACALIFGLLLLLNTLTKAIPALDTLRASILLPLSKYFKHKSLVKAAIKSDIRGRVNAEVREFGRHLPKGWVKEFDITWVDSEDKASLINEQKIVLRLRPVHDQAHNFVNVSYQFLKDTMFPKTQQVIPDGHLEATTLYVCRKIINRKDAETMTLFEDIILEPAIQRHNKIPEYLRDYAQLDARGFFLGTFLRELHLVAREVRFEPERSNIGSEASGIIKHVKEFIKEFDEGNSNIPSSLWYNISHISRYGLLLVAHPSKTSSGIDPYLKRAKEKLAGGANRLYVFGTTSEKDFFDAVVHAVDKTIAGWSLLETFPTTHDYRGAENGLGAIFIRKEEEVSVRTTQTIIAKL